MTHRLHYLSLLRLSVLVFVFLLNKRNQPSAFHASGTGFRYRHWSSASIFVASDASGLHKEDSKPKWAAGGYVSDIVNFLISIKPLFGLMKFAARQTLIE